MKAARETVDRWTRWLFASVVRTGPVVDRRDDPENPKMIDYLIDG